MYKIVLLSVSGYNIWFKLKPKFTINGEKFKNQYTCKPFQCTVIWIFRCLKLLKNQAGDTVDVAWSKC